MATRHALMSRSVLLLLSFELAWGMRPAPGLFGSIDSSLTKHRILLEPTCPVKYCKAGACSSFSSTTGKLFRCRECTNGRTPANPTSNPPTENIECVCPVGKRQDAQGNCVDCPFNNFCLQQPNNKVSSSKYVKRCPANTVTKKKGAKSLYACVNDKGYYYIPHILKQIKAQALKAKSLEQPPEQEAYQVSAASTISVQEGDVVAPCGPDTYSTGLEYQTECTPCPEGFHTDPANPVGSHTSSAVCVLAPGFYSPDNVTVVPCPKGEFADTYSMRTSCTPCDSLLGPGITTAGEGSTSASDCRILEPGYALVNAATQHTILEALQEGTAFSGARPCPQNYTCAGGDPSTAAAVPTRCPRGLWTQVDDEQDGELGPGAHSEEQCVAPPGWFDPANDQDIQECPSGTYKEGWDNAAACTPCGEGPWLSDRLTQVQIYDLLTGAEVVEVFTRGSNESCYIQQGMGVIQKAVGDTTVYEAVVCPPGFYGSDEEKRFGLDIAPCLACPTNQITHGTENRAVSYLDAAGTAVPTEEGTGYFSPQACVNKPGFGYSSFGSEMCDKGTFSAGFNKAPCTDCKYATTTLSTGSTSQEDCAVYAAGYGVGKSGNPISCPLGTYSDGTVPVGSPCTPCGNGRSTTDTGSESLADCRICAPGYGGPNVESCQPCGRGTYGPRAARGMNTECLSCPSGRVYKFHWESEYEDGDDFAPWATSPLYATSTSQCLAAYSQTVEGNVWIDLEAGPDFVKQENIMSLESCARACDSDDKCASVTFSYGDVSCWLWRPSSGGSSFAQSGGIAFKTVLSNVFAQSVTGDQKAAAASSGGVQQQAAAAIAAAPVPSGIASENEEDEEVKAATMGTGFYTYWKGASAASALAKKSLQDMPQASTLQECLTACTFQDFCAGVVFGALNPATMALSDIQGAAAGVKCQQVRAQVEVTGLRTLLRAKFDALRPSKHGQNHVG